MVSYKTLFYHIQSEEELEREKNKAGRDFIKCQIKIAEKGIDKYISENKDIPTNLFYKFVQLYSKLTTLYILANGLGMEVENEYKEHIQKEKDTFKALREYEEHRKELGKLR